MLPSTKSPIYFKHHDGLGELFPPIIRQLSLQTVDENVKRLSKHGRTRHQSGCCSLCSLSRGWPDTTGRLARPSAMKTVRTARRHGCPIQLSLLLQTGYLLAVKRKVDSWGDSSLGKPFKHRKQMKFSNRIGLWKDTAHRAFVWVNK